MQIKHIGFRLRGFYHALNYSTCHKKTEIL